MNYATLRIVPTQPKTISKQDVLCMRMFLHEQFLQRAPQKRLRTSHVLVLNVNSLKLLSYRCQYQSLGIERIVLLSEA